MEATFKITVFVIGIFLCSDSGQGQSTCVDAPLCAVLGAAVCTQGDGTTGPSLCPKTCGVCGTTTTKAPLTTSATSATSAPTGFACDNNPCLFGGTCKSLPGGSFECLCPPGNIPPLCLPGAGTPGPTTAATTTTPMMTTTTTSAPTTVSRDSCKSGEFACGDGKQCVDQDYRCDDDDDCDDFTDEIGCPGALVCNGTNTFQCTNTRCIKLSDRCDRYDDCGDNSDEANCKACNDRGDFKCGNGACVRTTDECDDQNDCGDNSDEIGCGGQCGRDGMAPCLNGGTCREFVGGTFECLCPDGRVPPFCLLEGPVTTQTPNPKCDTGNGYLTDPFTGCEATDVIFMVDDSREANKREIDREGVFIRTLIEQYNVTSTGVNVGLVVYDENVKEVIHLDDYRDDKARLLNSIYQLLDAQSQFELEPTVGYPDFNKALQFVKDESFKRGRQGVKKVVIALLTESTLDPFTVNDDSGYAGMLQTAKDLKYDCAQIFIEAIGSFGEYTNIALLSKYTSFSDLMKEMASEPNAPFYTEWKNYGALIAANVTCSN